MSIAFISCELLNSATRQTREVTLVMVKVEPAKSVTFSQQVATIWPVSKGVKTLHCQERATCKMPGMTVIEDNARYMSQHVRRNGKMMTVIEDNARYMSQAPAYVFHPYLYAPSVKHVRRNGKMIEKHPRYTARVSFEA